MAFAAVLSFYFFYSLNSGITITNDGSHFALFDSLTERGTPELLTTRQFAFGDSASYDGKLYSDRNPGLALTTYVVYKPLEHIEEHFQPLVLDPKFARHYQERQLIKIPIVMLVPAAAGAILLFLMFLMAQQLGANSGSAILASLVIGYGTIILRYSTVFYSHTLAAVFLCVGLFTLFRGRRTESSNQIAAAIFFLSYAVLIEHLVIIVFIPVAIYIFLTCKSAVGNLVAIIKLAIAGLLPMFVLMTYNFVCFGDALSIAHFHHATDTSNHSLNTLLRFEGAAKAGVNLLFGATREEVGRQDLLGLFSHSPFLMLLAIYPVLLARRIVVFSMDSAVILASILLLIFGGSSIWAPYGGWDRDYRYFMVAIPLFAPFLAQCIQWLLSFSTSVVTSISKAFIGFMTVIGCVISARNQLDHVRHAAQIQYNETLVNLDAAIWNVSMIVAIIGLIFLPALALKYRLISASENAS